MLLQLAMIADRVRISVADSSPAPPAPLEPTSDAESGRGLALLAALTSAWGSAPAPPGNQVWCELPPAN